MRSLTSLSLQIFLSFVYTENVQAYKFVRIISSVASSDYYTPRCAVLLYNFPRNTYDTFSVYSKSTVLNVASKVLSYA